MTSGIDGVGGLANLEGAAAVRRGRLRSAGGSGFAVPGRSDGASDAAGVGAATPASLLGAMLAVQEAEADRARNRAARRHGEAMLAELRALQLELLEGAMGQAALTRLADLADRVPAAADPGLAATVQWVALRARVELARREAETKTA
jgi:hypothetical protein